MQVAADVALRYARKEYYLSKGNNQKVPDKPQGAGQYTCKTCYMNFLTKEKLNTHNNGPQHKEVGISLEWNALSCNMIWNRCTTYLFYFLDQVCAQVYSCIFIVFCSFLDGRFVSSEERTGSLDYE